MVSDRVSPPICFADRVPGAGAGGNPSGSFVEEERQIRRIRADHSASFWILRHLADRSLPGPSRKSLGVVWRVASGLRLPCARSVSLASSRETPATVLRDPTDLESAGSR